MFNQKSVVMKNSLMILMILVLSSVAVSFSEARLIKGKVTDEQGNPLQGVSVSVKNSLTGTLTDNNGSYQLSVNQEDKVLVFSLAGFVPVSEKIEGRSVINATLKLAPEPVTDMILVSKDAKSEMFTRAAAAPSAVGGVAYESQAHFRRNNNNYNTEGYAAVNENGCAPAGSG